MKAFNLRMKMFPSIKENASLKEIEEYIQYFDAVLESMNWDESKLLDEIDKNWSRSNFN